MECVGIVDSGITTMAWSPDFEMVVMGTKKGKTFFKKKINSYDFITLLCIYLFCFIIIFCTLVFFPRSNVIPN